MTDDRTDIVLRTVIIPAVNAGLVAAAAAMQVEIKRRMGAEGGGVIGSASKRLVGHIEGDKVVYKFHKNRKGRGRNLYEPAPAGSAPGIRTGRLSGSISYARSWDDRTPGLYKLRVGTNVKYGKWLDQGTSRMKPRPWARSTALMSKDKMFGAFSAAFQRGVRGAGQ